MASRGVHFALTNAEREHILGLETDEEKIDYLQGTIEDAWDKANLQETDKAWLPIHRCLTDDSDAERMFDSDTGTLPLKLLVLGGRQVLQKEEEYIFRLIDPAQIPDLLTALKPITKKTFKAKFDKFCVNETEDYGPTAFEYTWTWFQKLRDFVKRINGSGRSIMFTVDQ